MGVNPDTCPVENGSIWNALDAVEKGYDCAYELLASFLVLLFVTLSDIEFL